jgi:activating signal cointegrator 1
MLKAISLWNPWAMLVALGLKKNETRGWATSHLGEIAIHAAMKCCNETYLQFSNTMLRADPTLREKPIGNYGGKILCVVDLQTYWQVEDIEVINNMTVLEVEAGNYSMGRYVWPLQNVRRLTDPVATPGRQKIWTLPIDVEAEVRRQIGC